MQSPLRRLPAAALGLLLLAAGCSLPPAQPDLTRYYVLTPAPARTTAAAADGPHWRVALRPVEMPSFLRGRSMQVRVAPNEITYSDEARWGETLGAGIDRVLRESLEGRGEIAYVVNSAAEEHDFDITVRVLRCEGDREKGVARFSATVEVSAAAPGVGRRNRDTFTTEVPGWDKQNYGQLAAKLSEAVDDFGGRIVTLLATSEKP